MKVRVLVQRAISFARDSRFWFCYDLAAHLLRKFLSDKPPVVQPQSVPLRVANYCLLAVGLFVLTFSRNPIFHALGGGLAALAGLSLERAYRIAKARRLELYGEEINRRMQNPPVVSTEDQKP
jgi:hypothetical protein